MKISIWLGLFLIFVAIWQIDWNDSNKIIIAILLILGGLINILSEMRSKTAQKIRSLLSYFAIFISILIIFKVWFYG